MRKVRRSEEMIKRDTGQTLAMEPRDYEAKLRDTEERLGRETERERSENRAIRYVLEHAPVGFVRLDHDQNVIETNPVFLKQFSMQPSDIEGTSLISALPGLPEALCEAINHGEAYQMHDLKVFEGVGSESSRYCDLTVWPVNGGEQSAGTILVTTEVTERVLLDLQRKDFVATLAHDLQTPVIASDRGLSLLLGKVDGRLEPDLINLITMLKKNNQNLLHMIESLVDLYQYEDGAKSLYFDEVDMALLAGTCIDEMSALARELGLTVESQFAIDLKPVFADRTAIRRVITNLIDNSIKFTPRGGTIRLEAHNNGTMVFFAVSDTGIGIKPEYKDHLFERYWHGVGHQAYKRSSGLGLFLCRQIVESHRGRIECDSSAARMTTFRFTLPIKTEGSLLTLESHHLKKKHSML